MMGSFRLPILLVLFTTIDRTRQQLASNFLIGSDSSGGATSGGSYQGGRSVVRYKHRDHGQTYPKSEYVKDGGVNDPPATLCSKNDNKTIRYSCDTGHSIAINRPYILEASGVNCELPKTCQPLFKTWLENNDVFVTETNDTYGSCREGMLYLTEHEFLRYITRCNMKQNCIFNLDRYVMYDNQMMMDIAGYPIMLVDHYEKNRQPYKCIKDRDEYGRDIIQTIEVCDYRSVLVEPGEAIYIKSREYPKLVDYDACLCITREDPQLTEIWIIHLQHVGYIRFSASKANRKRIFTVDYIFQPIHTNNLFFSMPEYFPQIELKRRRYKLWMIIENNNNFTIKLTCGHQSRVKGRSRDKPVNST